jgi:hypothetical protein
MKPWLKWLIGIVIVVLVVGGIAAGMYWWHTQQVAGNMPFYGRGFERNFGPGMMGRGFDRDFGPDMMNGRGFNRGFGFMPLGGLLMLPLMLLRWLFPLAIFGFAIYGLVAWFNRRKVTPVAAPISPAAVETAAPAEKTCASCGQPVQADWKHCPHCGNTL